MIKRNLGAKHTKEYDMKRIKTTSKLNIGSVPISDCFRQELPRFLYDTVNVIIRPCWK